MSYHYQMNNEFFDSSSYMPQMQMQVQSGYDFYPADTNGMITQQTNVQQPPQQQQQPQQTQQHNDHVIPFGWRPDWATTQQTQQNTWNGGGLTIDSSNNNNTNGVGIHSNILHSTMSLQTNQLDTYRHIPTSNQCYNTIDGIQNNRLLGKKTILPPTNSLNKSMSRTTPKPFKCHSCGKAFSQAANLTAHKRIHTGEKPFTCTVCHRPFSQSSSLVTHRRTHTGERPYPCDTCDKAFTDSSTLTKHLRTHSGHKPYSCDICMMRFTQSGNLHRHMKTHRPN